MMETPYFLLDKEKLDNNIDNFRKTLDNIWPNSIIAYSFKTNSLPWLLQYLKQKGCYAEVVSSTEYQLAMKMGYEKKKIVFNGPIKGKKEFLKAVSSKSIVNLDSVREIEWLEALEGNTTEILKVGLRVNFDLESLCPGEVGYKLDGTRFGFCYENGQFKECLKRLLAIKNIRISGIHMHTTSKTRSLNIYHCIASKACEIISTYHLNLDYVDMGGGYFGGMEGKPSFTEYVSVIEKELRRVVDKNKTTLILEPGAAIIGSPVSFITTVIDVKETAKSRIVTIDGSRINIDPLMIKKTYFFEIPKNGKKQIKKQIIAGFTCMDSDRLMILEDEKELKRGDKIIFNKVGSYTMALSPLFINYFPPVFLNDGGKIRIIRKKWGVEEYIR